MRHATLIATLQILFIAIAASADDPRRVSVSGHAEIEVEPDIATVQMGIFVFDRDLLKAKQETDGKIANVLGAFKKLDVKSDDVRTTQLHVKPKYKERDDNWLFVGYEITRSVTVTVRQMTQLNDILNKSIEAGANRVEDISLSTSKEREIKDQTLTQAIESAKRRATRLAEGFGAKLGKVVTIEAGREGGSVRYNLLSAPTFGESTYNPGKIKIESDVDVVFELTD